MTKERKPGIHHHHFHDGVEHALGVSTHEAFDNIRESTWMQHKRR